MLKQSISRWLTLLAVLLGLGYIPTRIAIAKHQAPNPELIFVLGGGNGRERLAAQFAHIHPTLEIWVSSGTRDTAEFAAARIPLSRVRLDHRASDTVTNFTSMVEDLKRHQIQHVYLVTSDFHMLRAQTIATLVFGSQGIAVTPIPVPDHERPNESPIRIARDAGRSLLWLATGRTGASLGRRVQGG